MTLLAAILLGCLSTGTAGAGESADANLIVRFADGLTKKEVTQKLEKAGASLVEVVSKERSTYLAKAKSPEARDQAIKQLQKDKQVKYAESEATYSADQKRRARSMAPRSPAPSPKAETEPAIESGVEAQE